MVTKVTWWHRNRLPDIAEQFAAEVFFAGLGAGHDAFGTGDDGHAEATFDAGKFGRADIVTQARGADSFQTFNNALLALVLQTKFDDPGEFPFDGDLGDVAFALEDAGDAFFHSGVRDFNG